MSDMINMDVDKYAGIIKEIDTSGEGLLEKTDCFPEPEKANKNAVIPDYVVAYEGLISTINYLMSVNKKVHSLMVNVMSYHLGIDQHASDQLDQAGDVFDNGK